jgi:hypothetical protein
MSIEATWGWDRLAPLRRRNKVLDGNIKLVLHVFRVAGKHETDHGGLRAQKEIDASISILGFIYWQIPLLHDHTQGLSLLRSLFCMTTRKVCLFCISRGGNLSCAYVWCICVLMVSPCQDKMIAIKTTKPRVWISQIQHVPVLYGVSTPCMASHGHLHGLESTPL